MSVLLKFFRNAPLDDFDQFGRTRDFPFLSFRCDFLCDPAGKTLFPVFGKDSPQGFFRIGVDDFFRREALIRIHAHIQRAVRVIAESPALVVQLKARNAEIQQNAVHRFDSVFFQDVFEIFVIVVRDRKSSLKLG